MPGAAKEEQDLAALNSSVLTISTLIAQLQSTAHAAAPKPDEKSSNVNALDLAHDTASLIKAHTTKLSLLIINKPFTPTAITKVLRELISGPLPGLASALEICDGARYTKVMASELQYRTTKVFSKLQIFVGAIPLDGKILSNDEKNGTGAAKGKGSLANTRVVWDACEAVMELKKLGVAGLLIEKAEEYRDLLKDALEELQEWGEEEHDEQGEQDSDEENDGATAQDEVDNMFGSQLHIPFEDPEKIRPRLESTKKKLRLVVLLYQAVIKRRFKSLPHLPRLEALPEGRKPSVADIETSEKAAVASRLDEALNVMRKIPDIADDLAHEFYQLDGEGIDMIMEECFSRAVAIAELLLTDWEGQKDEFTTWACKFQQAMKRE